MLSGRVLTICRFFRDIPECLKTASAWIEGRLDVDGRPLVQGAGPASGQGEVESCTATFFCIGPNFTPVAFNDTFDCGKSDPGSFVI